jgi:hypothetical protein
LQNAKQDWLTEHDENRSCQGRESRYDADLNASRYRDRFSSLFLVSSCLQLLVLLDGGSRNSIVSAVQLVGSEPAVANPTADRDRGPSKKGGHILNGKVRFQASALVF